MSQLLINHELTVASHWTPTTVNAFQVKGNT